MSQNDEFNLRDLLGDGDSDQSVPSIPDVPASQLPELTVPVSSKDEVNVNCAFCDCIMVAVVSNKQVCEAHRLDTTVTCATCARRRLIHDPNYIQNGHKTEPVHPVAEVVTTPQEMTTTIQSPALPDDAGKFDEEYVTTFNGEIEQIKDLEPESIQERQHKMLTMIRRAKIAVMAMQVTMEGKIALVDSKRRKAMLDADKAYRSRRVSLDKEGKASSSKGSSKSSTGLSAIEKQIKQFIKLKMSDDTIIQTLKMVGEVPSNVRELIAKHRA